MLYKTFKKMKTARLKAALVPLLVFIFSQTAIGQSKELKGIIKEKLDVDNYTYLKLKSSAEEFWVAVPTYKDGNIGKEVEVFEAMPMFGFESKQLKRKFDKIYFGVLQKSGQTPPQMSPQMPPQKLAQLPAQNIKVSPFEGKNSATLASIFNEKEKAQNKEVAIRGQVIKFNGGIMGKNWVHIADGTRPSDKEGGEITVVTNDKTAVGDIVVAKGKITLNKKVEHYAFPVAIEDGTITVEKGSSEKAPSKKE